MSKLSDAVNYLVNVFSMKCPRCRQGKVFKHGLSLSTKKNLDMHTQCPDCGQYTEIEVGFYYGTGYVSYGITVLFTMLSFVLWLIFLGFSLDDNSVFLWFITNAVVLVLLQPWLMRFSRILWLSWFVKYDRDWEKNKVRISERVIESQMEGRQNIKDETLK